MRDIEVIHGEGLPRLFSQIGVPMAGKRLQCGDLSQARELLNNEYFDHAMLEAANDLGAWRLERDHRRAADEEPQLRKDGDACEAEVREKFGLLRDVGFEKAAQDKLVRKTTSIMVLAMIERRWNMPMDDRIFSPLDTVIAQGHIVCGWVEGLYPDGEWVVW